MKKFVRAIQNFRWAYLLFAILFAGAGFCFLVFPENALEYVRIAIGIVTIVFGGVMTALTLSGEKRGFRFWARMMLSVLAMVCGGFMIFAKESAFSYLVFVAGIYLAIDGSFKLQTAILSKRYKSWLWWVMLVLAAGAIGIGVVMIRVRFDFAEELLKVSKILGVGLFIDGVENLLSIYYLWRIDCGERKKYEEQLREEGKLVTITDAATPTKEEKRALKAARAEEKRAAKAARHAIAQETADYIAVPTEVAQTAAATAEPTPAPSPAATEIPLANPAAVETVARAFGASEAPAVPGNPADTDGTPTTEV